MKALTVRQPWAKAIIYGGKDVENRTFNTKHRGPLAIHAGLSVAWGSTAPMADVAFGGWSCHADEPGDMLGAVIGTVDLVNVHRAEVGCCESRWAEGQYVESGGRVRRSVMHLVLANPLPLPVPLVLLGRLGVWELDGGVS